MNVIPKCCLHWRGRVYGISPSSGCMVNCQTSDCQTPSLRVFTTDRGLTEIFFTKDYGGKQDFLDDTSYNMIISSNYTECSY